MSWIRCGSALARAHLCRDKPYESTANDFFGFGHDALNKLFTGRDVVNEPGDHAATPGAGIQVAILQHFPIDRTGNQRSDIVNLELIFLLLLKMKNPLDGRIVQNAFGIT